MLIERAPLFYKLFIAANIVFSKVELKSWTVKLYFSVSVNILGFLINPPNTC